MAYDPYKAAEQIVRNKGRWGTAVADGKSGDEYHKRARYYYDELRSNGYSGIADKLESSDYHEALAYLDSLKPQGGDYNASKELSDASADRESLEKRRTELQDALRAGYGELYGEMKNGVSKYGEEILERYRKAGEAATGHTVAEGAAANGGNIDSYAVANAHRQMNAYLTAGTEAADAAENERASRLLDILGGIYSSGKGLVESEMSAIESKEDLAANIYRAELDDAEAKRKEELQLQISREERDGAWEKITPEDFYGDRYEKYFDALLKIYPQYAEEINALFHYLG